MNLVFQQRWKAMQQHWDVKCGGEIKKWQSF